MSGAHVKVEPSCLPFHEQPFHFEPLCPFDQHLRHVTLDEFRQTRRNDRLRSHPLCEQARRSILWEAGQMRDNEQPLTEQQVESIAYNAFRRTGRSLSNKTTKQLVNQFRSQLRKQLTALLTKFPNDLFAVELELRKWSYYPYIRWARSLTRVSYWEADLRNKILRGDVVQDNRDDDDDSDCMIVDDPEEPVTSATSPKPASVQVPSSPSPSPSSFAWGTTPTVSSMKTEVTPLQKSLVSANVSDRVLFDHYPILSQPDQSSAMTTSMNLVQMPSTSSVRTLDDEFQYLLPQFNRTVARSPEKFRAIKNLMLRIADVIEDCPVEVIRQISDSLPESQ